MARLVLEYHEAQEAMFHGPHIDRWNVYPKGRRFGATTGAGFAVVEWLLAGHRVLWGDTIYGNIERYFTRIIRPVLERSGIPFYWRTNGSELRIGAGTCDFRSADNPTNWEGFGYSRIVLNEAGIILKDEYLYRNAVLPMMADFPDSRLFAIGTPKGAHGVFYDLWRRVEAGEPGYQGRRFSSYDNPFIDVANMREVERGIGPEQAQQEVYGYFISSSSTALYPAHEVAASMSRSVAPGPGLQVGVDVAWTGDDKSVIAVRRGDLVLPLVKLAGASPMEVAARAAQEATRYALPGERPLVVVDVIGIGAGVYDVLSRDRRLVAVPMNAAAAALDPERFGNARAEAAFAVKEWMDAGGALPSDDELRADMSAAEYEFDARGRYRLPLKDRLRKKLGRSPDCLDAVGLAVYRPTETEPRVRSL